MVDAKIFDILYSYLEERSNNNISSQLSADPKYQNALVEKCELYQQYENLNLLEEHCKIVTITTTNSAYSSVIFRMGMQFCFPLLIQLSVLN